jgi:hypothetical protein
VFGLTSARARNRDVEIAIGVSLVAHALLLSWLVWEMAAVMSQHLLAKEREKPTEEVTLLYPEQILQPEPEVSPVPPQVPKPEAKPYVRTTQNAAVAEAPKQADFVSDRNTVAASELPPDAAGKPNMPTQEGIDFERNELANRDYKDGQIKEDGATPVPAMKVTEAAPAPPPSSPPPAAPTVSPPTPVPAPVAAAPVPAPAPAPVEVVKAVPVTPLEAMMREQDEGEAARLSLEPKPVPMSKGEGEGEGDLEVKVMPTAEPLVKAVPVPVPEMRTVPDAPPKPDEPLPPMRQPDAPGGAVPEPVKRTAGPQDADAFSPFTRTSKVRGTISNRGEAAVNAAETPVGRYMRLVTSAVEKKWHLLRRQNADAVTFGNLQLRFFVESDGSVRTLDVISDKKKADPRMLDFTLRAILEAEIPAIPPDLLPLLDRQRLEVEYDVLIY